MTPTVTFTCSICGEPSGEICVFCTKDACGNHVCEKCRRCSDCCECEIHLEEHWEAALAAPPRADVVADVVAEEEVVVVSEVITPESETPESETPEAPAQEPTSGGEEPRNPDAA